MNEILPNQISNLGWRADCSCHTVQIILGIMSVNLDGLEHTLGNYSSQKGNECFSGAHLLSLSCFSVLWLIDAGSRTSVALCTLTSHVYSFWKEHLHKSNDADVTGPF